MSLKRISLKPVTVVVKKSRIGGRFLREEKLEGDADTLDFLTAVPFDVSSVLDHWIDGKVNILFIHAQPLS